jgi:hypothetical protein
VNGLIHALTDKAGIVAAILVVLSVLGFGFTWVVKPLWARRKNMSNVVVSGLQVSDLAVWGNECEVRFELVNTRGGSALVRELKLRVLSARATDSRRETVTSSPVSVHTHRVELRPGKSDYDIRAKSFREDLPPLRLDAGEPEAFVVKIVTRESHWYSLVIEAGWCDLSRPAAGQTASSEPFEIDFPTATGSRLKSDTDRSGS